MEPEGSLPHSQEPVTCPYRGTNLFIYLFTAVNVARLCPLVLPVTLGYRQVRALGTEGGKVMDIGLFEYLVEEKVPHLGRILRLYGCIMKNLITLEFKD